MHSTAVGSESFRRTRFSQLRSSEQAAAVCYRISRRGVEFLLVQTGGGRWTFPKGNAEPGLSQAQAAALEAFEEAGVHGRIEEVSFARYSCNKRVRNTPASSGKQRLSVSAHLCEVLRVEAPQESGRNPNWFTADQCTRRLREGRTREDGTELTQVVDRAVARIRDLQSATARATATRKDALQQVSFERPELGNSLREAALLRYMRSNGQLPRGATRDSTADGSSQRFLRLEAGVDESESEWTGSGRTKAGRKISLKQLPN